MPGFMSSSTAFTLCKADGSKFCTDALRKHVFSPASRTGWVGLGDPLDVDFAFDCRQEQYAVFSLRADTRKASSAAVRLQLAEAVKEEGSEGKKVTGKRKKELKETIVATLTSKAPFIPALTDCLWDLDKNRLFVSTSSAKALLPVFDLFKSGFGIEPAPITAKGDMASLFAEICRNEQYECNGFVLSPFGSASLETPGQAEDKALVAVQNNLNAVASALDEGLKVQKLRLVVTDAMRPDFQLDFSVDTNLSVSGLRLPKAEKGADPEAEFLLKADVCSNVASIIEALATA